MRHENLQRIRKEGDRSQETEVRMKESMALIALPFILTPDF